MLQGTEASPAKPQTGVEVVPVALFTVLRYLGWRRGLGGAGEEEETQVQVVVRFLGLPLQSNTHGWLETTGIYYKLFVLEAESLKARVALLLNLWGTPPCLIVSACLQ